VGQKIRFYTDEHVASAVVHGLRQRGVDVLSVPGAGLLGATDKEHLARARTEGRVLFTQDPDFLRLHAEGARHAGIVYAAQGTSIGDIIRGLMLIPSSAGICGYEGPCGIPVAGRLMGVRFASALARMRKMRVSSIGARKRSSTAPKSTTLAVATKRRPAHSMRASASVRAAAEPRRDAPARAPGSYRRPRLPTASTAIEATRSGIAYSSEL